MIQNLLMPTGFCRDKIIKWGTERINPDDINMPLRCSWASRFRGNPWPADMLYVLILLALICSTIVSARAPHMKNETDIERRRPEGPGEHKGQGPPNGQRRSGGPKGQGPPNGQRGSRPPHVRTTTQATKQ